MIKEELVKKKVPWKNKKCSTCKLGFNSKSNPIKCDGCDSFTHQKTSCLKEGISRSQFYCKTCIPESVSRPNSDNATLVTNDPMIKVDNGYKCRKCGLTVKPSYSMKRHIAIKHKEEPQNNTE